MSFSFFINSKSQSNPLKKPTAASLDSDEHSQHRRRPLPQIVDSDANQIVASIQPSKSMRVSFSIKSKSQSNCLKRPTAASFSGPAKSDSLALNYVSEFRADVSKIKRIAPLPNTWHPNKKLKNLPSLPESLQFELDAGTNPDISMGFGLNLRQPSATTLGQGETRIFRRLKKEGLENSCEDPGFDDVPVEKFAAALLSGYGWKKGRGIGRKEDVKVSMKRRVRKHKQYV